MTTIDFMFDSQKLTLDLKQGLLVGNSAAKNKLVSIIDSAQSSAMYYGSDYTPVPAITIDDVYRNIEQFATCLMFELPADEFPAALSLYVAKWPDDLEPLTDDEQMAAELLDDLMIY